MTGERHLPSRKPPVAFLPEPVPVLLVGGALLALLLLGTDLAVTQWVKAQMPGAVVQVFRGITRAGESQWYLVPTGLGLLGLLAARRWATVVWQRLDGASRFWPLAYVFGCVALGGIAVNIIKLSAGRARPRLLLNEGIYGFFPFTAASGYTSFPSGHTQTAVALALSVGVLAPRLRPVLLLFAALIALSRVIVGAHYPSDVVGGAMLAALVCWGLRWELNRRGIPVGTAWGPEPENTWRTEAPGERQSIAQKADEK